MKSFDNNVLEIYDFSDDDIWDDEEEDEIFYPQEESSESFIKSIIGDNACKIEEPGILSNP